MTRSETHSARPRALSGGGRPLAHVLIAAAAALSPFAVACAQEGAAQPAFEGAFTQTEDLSQSGGVPSATIRQITRITGSLVWSREEGSEQNLPHLPSFGDVASTFYVPTDGEIRVEFEYDGRSAMSACHFTGSRTFSIAELSPNALNYMALEVAQDGRYKLVLGMMSGMLPVPIQNKGCRAMLGLLSLDVDNVWRDASIEIGYRNGVISGDKIEGAMPPLVAGPSTTTGSWSFVRVGARND